MRIILIIAAFLAIPVLATADKVTENCRLSRDLSFSGHWHLYKRCNGGITHMRSNDDELVR